MTKPSSLNSIQINIIASLRRNPPLRFAQLNNTELENDHFSYHIRQLLKHELIEKSPSGNYTLTTPGKQRALMLNDNQDDFIDQGFIAVRIVIKRQRPDGEREYLLQERSIEPFAGYLTTPGVKVPFGESLMTTARQQTKVETGLYGRMRICGIFHYMDEFKGKTIEDKFFYVFFLNEPNGKLLPVGDVGRNIWLTKNKISLHPRQHNGLIEILDSCETQEINFAESTFANMEY